MELLYAQLSGLEQTQAEVLCLLKTRQRICLKEHQVWCARNEDAQESKAPDQHHNPCWSVSPPATNVHHIGNAFNKGDGHRFAGGVRHQGDLLSFAGLGSAYVGGKKILPWSG